MNLKKKSKDRERDEPKKKDPVHAVAASCTCGWSRSGDPSEWMAVAGAGQTHRMLHRMGVK